MVREAVDFFYSLVEAPVVTSVGAKLGFLCEVGPPLVLDNSQLALEIAVCSAEGSFLHGEGWLGQVRLA